MIPDGVATAALEPMETLEANVAPGAQPPAGEGEGSNQAASQMEEVIGEPMGGSGQGEPAPSKEAPPTAKIGNSKTSADPKAKSSAKTPTKTKPGATGPTKTTTGPGSRPNTAQSRLTNGVNKSQTNGVAKKTSTTTTNPGAGDKKSTPTSAASKRPAGSAAAPASKTPTKPADRKPLGTTRPSTAPASNGLKSATGTAAAAKKAPTAAPANGVKTAAAAAKKPAAPRPASAAPTKPSSTAAPKTDRTPVSKTTRPSTGTASSRPASAATRPATAGATKSTTPTTKPLTPKTTTPTPIPRAAASTTPSAGRTPTSLASKTTTPVKKDVTKPATPVAKKPAASPLTRPASAKTAKPDTPKSASKPDSSATKKPAASKATETKTKPKTQETKPAPTKTPATKPAAAKSSSPKKAVGSSTPMPVKRGPKPTTAGEPEAKEDDSSATVAAAAAAAVTVASAAAAVTLATAEEEELVSTTQAQPEPEPAAAAAAAVPQLSAQLDLVHLGGPADDLTSPLGTTVMSPPCSPPGPMSPVREPQRASLLLDPHAQHEPWSQSQSQEMRFQQEEDEKENLLIPSSTAAAGSFSMMGHPDLLGTSPVGGFTSASLSSPSQDKEVAVEKADEEINDDDEDDDEEEERKAGQQTSSLFTDMSGSQPSEEFHVRSSGPGGSAGWHGEDLLSAMDSEEVSSSTSSRQQGVSEMSSTQHTGLLEGTQSSDALVDSSLRGSEGDANFMGSPNVETLANDEEDEEEEEERVDEMDVSSERADDHHMGFQQREQQQQQRHHHHHEEKEEEEEDDEDVEMPSEGVTESGLESCGYVDEDEDFNEEERVDNLNRSVGALPPVPPSSAWGQSKPLNPFADPWAQPSLLSTTTHTSSPSPLSDHGAADPETPTMSPAQAWLDMSGHSLVPEAALEPHHQEKTGAEASAQLAAPAVGMSQSSTLSGTALAAHSSSETSTPEELQDYDSSSGVESRSDKQQTPVPASVQPDMEQDLGIHLERGDGEEEEAETLPADEVMGTGPPTAPASAPSSPSTSGDEASDTEGEMQINDPDAPLTTEDRAGFDSPPPARNLPALEEDEEAVDAHAGEGEEDGGGGTPQSANSVASYGFDCTTSNSNAHSTAESCGKSPGIFSLENEDQLPEEAKDPSFIKELTLPAAAAAYADDLLDGPVDLLPLGHPGENRAGLDDHHHHYMLGGKMGADGLEEVDPLEPSLRLGGQHAGDSSDGYYSAICDKTDSFLAGEENICADPDDDDDDYEEDVESDQEQQSESVPALEEQHANQQNQNLSSSVPIANGHYLAEVPGNRRPIDPVLAASFSLIVPPPPANNNNNTTHTTNKEGGGSDGCAGGQLRRLEQHQEHLREVQHRQEQERQKRQWLEEERQRLEQQKQLDQQRRELLQLQLQQQQQEHRHRRQVLQWQLELEQQHRLQQKQMQQQQQQARRSPTGVMLSPSTGLCTIYEAMETSEEEEEEDEEAGGEQNGNGAGLREKGRCSSNQTMTTDSFRRMRPVPPQDLDWSQKVDMVQQLINQTLLLSGDGGCPPLLLLPVGTGGTLSPLESSMWPSLLPPFSPSSATVTSVSSYSPDSQGSSFPGDWTVVEVETQH